MPKATSVTPGKSAARSRTPKGSQAASTERKAAKVIASAQQEAARVRAEAEEHARGLVLDARATADGIRAEGMEVVSNLRQISDTLRDLSDRVLQDVEAIHARMVRELERVAPEGAAPAAEPPSLPAPASGSSREAADELDVPDFVARG